MNNVHFLPAALLSLAFSGLGVAASAQPDFINGGIGSPEVAQIEAQARGYNLRLVFSEGPKNDYVANVALRVLDGQGHEVLALNDAGPLTSIRLPAGRYVIDAKYGPLEQHNPVELKPGAPVDLYLHFPNGEKLS